MGIRTIETRRIKLSGRRLVFAATAGGVIAAAVVGGMALDGSDSEERLAASASTLSPRFVEQVQERRLALDEEDVSAASAEGNVKLQKSIDLFLTDDPATVSEPNVKLEKTMALFFSDEDEPATAVNMKLIRSLDLLDD
jgi:hypothetical protein